MAFLRLLRARRGESDPLVAAANLSRGETVLDATLGLGGDALLAAQVTGTRVIGLEIDPVAVNDTLADRTGELPDPFIRLGARIGAVKWIE